MNNNGKGVYQSQQESDCLEKYCCNETCFQLCLTCICEVGIRIICEVILKHWSKLFVLLENVEKCHLGIIIKFAIEK